MKKAFTLMELMVSIVLIVLITMFLYNAIATMKISNKTLAQHDKNEDNRTKIFELFYRDIVESTSLQSLQTKDKHFNVLELQTHNSLYQIAMPYVTYFVSKDKDRLIRLEAAKKIDLPVKYEDKFAVHADLLISDVTDFNVYAKSNDINQSLDKNSSEVNNFNNTTSVLFFLKTDIFKDALLLELAI
jgi:prepilin-type N-terminal cleavage/methylation domain-containing protein